MSNEEIFQTMKDLVSEQFGMELDEVTLETSFEDDLGADSVDLVELVMAMRRSSSWDRRRRTRSRPSRPWATR